MAKNFQLERQGRHACARRSAAFAIAVRCCTNVQFARDESGRLFQQRPQLVVDRGATLLSSNSHARTQSTAKLNGLLKKAFRD
ncbi:MAG: hypothetical protein K2Y19_19850 [Afipia birgiae]|nr:hypothetical protein [Afipia birgiae]